MIPGLTTVRNAHISQNVFSYPEVAFNLPVGKNKVISVEGANEEEEIVTSHFRFGIREFSVKNLKTKKLV